MCKLVKVYYNPLKSQWEQVNTNDNRWFITTTFQYFCYHSPSFSQNELLKACATCYINSRVLKKPKKKKKKKKKKKTTTGTLNLLNLLHKSEIKMLPSDQKKNKQTERSATASVARNLFQNSKQIVGPRKINVPRFATLANYVKDDEPDSDEVGHAFYAPGSERGHSSRSDGEQSPNDVAAEFDSSGCKLWYNDSGEEDMGAPVSKFRPCPSIEAFMEQDDEEMLGSPIKPSFPHTPKNLFEEIPSRIRTTSCRLWSSTGSNKSLFDPEGPQANVNPFKQTDGPSLTNNFSHLKSGQRKGPAAALPESYSWKNSQQMVEPKKRKVQRFATLANYVKNDESGSDEEGYASYAPGSERGNSRSDGEQTPDEMAAEFDSSRGTVVYTYSAAEDNHMGPPVTKFPCFASLMASIKQAEKKRLGSAIKSSPLHTPQNLEDPDRDQSRGEMAAEFNSSRGTVGYNDSTEEDMGSPVSKFPPCPSIEAFMEQDDEEMLGSPIKPSLPHTPKNLFEEIPSRIRTTSCRLWSSTGSNKSLFDPEGPQANVNPFKQTDGPSLTNNFSHLKSGQRKGPAAALPESYSWKNSQQMVEPKKRKVQRFATLANYVKNDESGSDEEGYASYAPGSERGNSRSDGEQTPDEMAAEFDSSRGTVVYTYSAAEDNHMGPPVTKFPCFASLMASIKQAEKKRLGSAIKPSPLHTPQNLGDPDRDQSRGEMAAEFNSSRGTVGYNDSTEEDMGSPVSKFPPCPSIEAFMEQDDEEMLGSPIKPSLPHTPKNLFEEIPSRIRTTSCRLWSSTGSNKSLFDPEGPQANVNPFKQTDGPSLTNNFSHLKSGQRKGPAAALPESYSWKNSQQMVEPKKRKVQRFATLANYVKNDESGSDEEGYASYAPGSERGNSRSDGEQTPDEMAAEFDSSRGTVVYTYSAAEDNHMGPPVTKFPCFASLMASIKQAEKKRLGSAIKPLPLHTPQNLGDPDRDQSRGEMAAEFNSSRGTVGYNDSTEEDMGSPVSKFPPCPSIEAFMNQDDEEMLGSSIKPSLPHTPKFLFEEIPSRIRTISHRSRSSSNKSLLGPEGPRAQANVTPFKQADSPTLINTLDHFKAGQRKGLKRSRRSSDTLSDRMDDDVPMNKKILSSRYLEEFYEVEKLGEGAFSIVNKCIHRLDGCPYAIKMSKMRVVGSGMNEVYAHAVLGAHLHIVRYYSAWSENSHMYIQNEFCNGGSLAEDLADRVENKRRMLEDELKLLLLQVADGLRYIHAQNLVHLDIKPENIFLHNTINESAEETGFQSSVCYKIGDLGHVTSVQHPDVRPGDARYLAAEIFSYHFGHPCNDHLPKADIFSLALTVYQAGCSRKLPQNGSGWHQIRLGNLPRLANVTDTFHEVLTSMMHPDPAKRPSASDLLHHPFLRPSNLSKAQLEQQLNEQRSQNQMLTKELEELKK